MVRYHERGRHGRAVQDLGGRILSGEFAPGEILDLEAIAGEYGVSRPTLREALKVLSGKGLVDSRQRHGTFIQEPSEWNLLDPDVLRWRFEYLQDPALFEQLNELRAIVEPEAARLASVRRSAEDVEALSEAVSRMSAHQSSREVQEFVAADVDFHVALLSASHNDLVGSLSSVIEVGLAVRDSLVHAKLSPTRSSVQAHRRVLDAIVARNPDLAAEEIRTMLSGAAKDVRRVVAKKPAEG
jgi:DNA-binding FadR family transcriptional regulator